MANEPNITVPDLKDSEAMAGYLRPFNDTKDKTKLAEYTKRVDAIRAANGGQYPSNWVEVMQLLGMFK